MVAVKRKQRGMEAMETQNQKILRNEITWNNIKVKNAFNRHCRSSRGKASGRKKKMETFNARVNDLKREQKREGTPKTLNPKLCKP